MSNDGIVDAAQEKAVSFLKEMRDKVEKVVRLKTGNPGVLLQLRKKLDVSIPMAPSLRFLVGTDVKLADRDLGYDLKYHPNFQWGITESWFNGTIEVDTMNKEVKYTKIFDLDAVALKVSGTYDYLHNAPFFGIQVQTTAGVSSPANANGFSIRKTFATSQKGVALEAEVEATLLMGEHKYNPVEKKMKGMPAEVDISRVRLLVMV
mmetsp:Transcript_27977/g.68831  ORF Transcript_27977/g.68831 Transcript_27977/m.68831 type:complete len:206 (-) Transcript_27977:897-1514(-)|eukprot:CAMPEP_0197609222 /NCGR_PEP_ID=MMETSP1326-20131121/50719_1 /TAXON_ID=1155430 /ORGANISM="Genus nov. species nov., Strain RCC2288" /LENGTH=205 /DNA_ID=CAMNT_0043177565 /DNA_START=62 /DNA_END=679 /DNA_ORIENTATION=+